MMRGVIQGVVTTILFIAAAASVATAEDRISTAYRVVGDPEAAPVQVFDDGVHVYVQLRDIASVPAPFVDGVPADYRIRGHYMLLPLIPRFQLRLGSAVVLVERTGMVAGQQAKVFATVDPLAPGFSDAIPAADTPPIGLGMGGSNRVVAALQEGVTGEILLEGEPEASGASARPATDTRRAIPHAMSPREAIPSEAGVRGKHVKLVADGTVAGARHAEGLRAACVSAGGICSISYRGAEAGTTIMEML